MLPKFMQTTCRANRFHPGLLVLEVCAVVVLGVVIALAGNQFKDSKDRFDLSRNYFNLPRPDDTNDDDAFQLIDHADTMTAFQSLEYEDGRCIFIDARNDEAYSEKHIPGAYQLDHYFVDRYVDALLPLCRNAERIIVYCNGGKCEDSKLAALDLIERGVAADRLFVYIGGVVAWGQDGLPFEQGERLSGEIIYDIPE